MQATRAEKQSPNIPNNIELKSETVPLLRKDFMADIETNNKSKPTTGGNTSTNNDDKPDKPSTTNVFNNITIINVNNSGDPGKNGTYMSFLCIIIGMIVSIITFKYAPSNINRSNWNDYCPSQNDNSDFYDSCKANSAVLRISCALTILFGLQIIGTKLYTPFYDILWVIKWFILIGLIVAFFFGVNGDHFDTGGYAWFARITGFFFLILQQIILLDLAYTWNERWVGYADGDGERGRYWLGVLVFISLILYMGSYAVLGILYWQFTGCDNTIVIISLTVAFTLIATMIQLFFSDQGSILTSGIMTAYATYVCYSAVILNPSSSCNPSLHSSYQTVSAIIGIILTVISLLWTTYNTVKKIPTVTNTASAKQAGASIDLMDVATGGAESSQPAGNRTSVNTADSTGGPPDDLLKTLLLQISVVFMLVSGYYAMILTNWATVQSSTSIDQPRTGEAAMWIQAAGEWIAIGFYIWSLIAPGLFPDREF